MPFLPRLCLALLCCLFAACGSQSEGLLRLDPGPDETGPSPYVALDPRGPIPAPSLPEELTSKAKPALDALPSGSGADETAASSSLGALAPPAGEAKAEEANLPRISYSVKVVTPDAVPELEDAFLAVSVLNRMRDSPPHSVMGLDQRMRSDLETAKDVLRSYGYYAGEVTGKIARRKTGEARGEDYAAASPQSGAPGAYTVTITFTPGTLYTVGKTRVAVTDPDRLRPDPAKGKYTPPAQTLADVGLRDGDPALAGKVLDAVSAMRENFRDRGYPFAAVASSRYVLDHGNQTLEADIVMDSGPLVYMDGLEVKGESPVKKRYLDALTTWKPGQPWNQSLVENYRSALRRGGLFSSAELNPAEEENEHGQRAVVAELTAAPARTVGGALKYDTDFGPGVQAYWEHRNITGRGDRLRIEIPLWADLQELLATYRLPFFLRRNQDFTARAAYRKEDTDAYKLSSYLASAGLERRFTPRWTGSVEVYAEGGEMEDPDEAKTSYLMMGLPASIAYSNANSLLDATKGVRLHVSAAPYTGEYHKNFNVLRAKVEGQAFIPVIGENSLVLALRAMYGLISDTNAQDVPASIRFYAGGGGSVRGYEYQSLGPRNDSNDPLGGASAVEAGAEARMRFNETWGMVAFIDGGMAYEDAAADITRDELRWGAGVGARIYTAIGPIRLDFAVPLNPRGDDDDFQIYFSIGQSF